MSSAARPRLNTLAAAPLGVALAGGVAAPAAAQPGERRIDRVEDAYAGLDAYHADCTFEIVQQNGAWTNRRRATLELVYDPAGRRLLIDDPEALLVVRDNTLLARLHDTPGRYVEHDLPDGWRWADLTDAAPFLVERPLPDIAFLVDPEPIDALSQGFNERATPLPPEPGDAQGRPRLQFHTEAGVFTLALDPSTRRLAAASHDLADLPTGQALAYTYRWSPRPADAPLPDDVFAFDTTRATAVSSFDQLQQGGGPGRSAPPPAIEPGDALRAELPTLDGEPIALADADASTLVLGFVTTWAAGGADAITALDAAAGRAAEQNADAAFYVVNLYEPADAVASVVEPLDIDLPILIDIEGVLAEAVHAYLVPTVVVVRDGKVVETLNAAAPGLADRLVEIAAERTRPDNAPAPSDADPPDEPEPSAKPDRLPPRGTP